MSRVEVSTDGGERESGDSSGSQASGALESATLLERLSQTGPVDTSGADTFVRYKYQAKVAAQRWLVGIDDESIVAVVCEYVDDIASVHTDRVRFTQLKTRDRGAWTVARVLSASGGGIDSLVRSYNASATGGFQDKVELELVLEGPSTERKKDREFFDNPTTAPSETRDAIAALGIDANVVDDFLSRLTVRTNFYSRDSIDAVTLRSLSAMFKSLGYPELELLYQQLLDHVEAAQSGAAGKFTATWATLLDPESESKDQLVQHLLTREHLLELLPPTTETLDERLRALEVLGNPAAGSRLEVKLIAAGASEDTVEQAKSERARAAFRIAEMSNDASNHNQQLKELADRVLAYANAIAGEIDLEGHTNASIAHRQGQAIWLRLFGNPANLVALDTARLFDRSHSELLGLLCDLSDQCQFRWRVA